jgi:hypothetical protein
LTSGNFCSDEIFDAESSNPALNVQKFFDGELRIIRVVPRRTQLCVAAAACTDNKSAKSSCEHTHSSPFGWLWNTCCKDIGLNTTSAKDATGCKSCID